MLRGLFRAEEDRKLKGKKRPVLKITTFTSIWDSAVGMAHPPLTSLSASHLRTPVDIVLMRRKVLIHHFPNDLFSKSWICFRLLSNHVTCATLTSLATGNGKSTKGTQCLSRSLYQVHMQSTRLGMNQASHRPHVTSSNTITLSKKSPQDTLAWNV